MGWVVLALVGVAAAAGLWALGLSRRLWSLGGAVLVLGAVGYALQGRPALPAHTVIAESAPIAIDPGMAEFREIVFNASRDDVLALATADGRLAKGDARGAAQGLVQVLEQRPESPTLWTDLGYVLALHDSNVSPSAKVAFERAFALAPHAPGPPFFLGMAYVDAGDFAAARPAWIEALRLTPANAPYRRDIVVRIAAIDQFQRMAAAQQAAGKR